jgi:hypothetical protein
MCDYWGARSSRRIRRQGSGFTLHLNWRWCHQALPPPDGNACDANFLRISVSGDFVVEAFPGVVVPAPRNPSAVRAVCRYALRLRSRLRSPAASAPAAFRVNVPPLLAGQMLRRQCRPKALEHWPLSTSPAPLSAACAATRPVLSVRFLSGRVVFQPRNNYLAIALPQPRHLTVPHVHQLARFLDCNVLTRANTSTLRSFLLLMASSSICVRSGGFLSDQGHIPNETRSGHYHHGFDTSNPLIPRPLTAGVVLRRPHAIFPEAVIAPAESASFAFAPRNTQSPPSAIDINVLHPVSMPLGLCGSPPPSAGRLFLKELSRDDNGQGSRNRGKCHSDFNIMDRSEETEGRD